MIELSAYLKHTLSKRLDSGERSVYRQLHLCGAFVGKKQKSSRAQRQKRWDTKQKRMSFVHITYKSVCVPTFRVFLLLVFHFMSILGEIERETKSVIVEKKDS